MHPYTVKNYLWVVIVSLFVVIMLLTGCSSNPKVSAQTPQYCHTSQNIVVRNGEKVDSATLVKCTDDQIERLTARRIGVAPNCGQFTYWTQIGGQNVQRKGISCQKLDGTWEVVNTSGH